MMQVVMERLLNVALPLFVAPFLIFTALAFLKKGKAAFNWSSGLTESVRVNTALMLVNSALAPFIALTLGPLQQFMDAGGVWRLDPVLWQALPVWLVVLLAVMLAVPIVRGPSPGYPRVLPKMPSRVEPSLAYSLSTSLVPCLGLWPS